MCLLNPTPPPPLDPLEEHLSPLLQREETPSLQGWKQVALIHHIMLWAVSKQSVARWRRCITLFSLDTGLGASATAVHVPPAMLATAADARTHP